MGFSDLRAYLDNGSSLDGLPFLSILTESVVNRPMQDPEGRRAAADRYRRLGEQLERCPGREDMARMLRWAAETYEDERLASRFERTLLSELLSATSAGATPEPAVDTQERKTRSQ